MVKSATLLALALILAVSPAAAALEPGPLKPTQTDKCPVCGMFVAHYPDFIAQVVFQDGSSAYFCGVKDMLQYYFDLPKYNPAKKTAEAAKVIVTDYSDMQPTDGFQAYYVVGSVVFGPMGQEFFPFRREAAAQEFLRENNGKEIIRFKQLNPEVLKELIKKY